MLPSTRITNTDFNQTLQNVWLKSVLCSKLGGGLANSLIDFNVDVHPINNNYDEIKAMLHERILRNSDCVKQKASYVSMPDRMRSLDNMYDQNQTEKDLYFYHSDHLGSSSFITDADGITTQHLQYLPYGELFVEQRSTANYFTPYKFSAKEKDEETSYSYFGARYLASDFSFWLSVDPMADKYPYQSPYSYCGWRPINVIDPDGMDEWEVNKKGEVNWIKECKKHTLFALDENGNRIKNNSLTLRNRKIFDQLDSKSNGISKAVTSDKGQDDMINAFKFLADNTNVEWRLDRFSDNGDNKYALGSNHTLPNDLGGEQTSPSAEAMGHSASSVISFIHSHPNADRNLETSSMGWWPNKDGTTTISGDSYLKKNSNLKNANIYTYFPKSGNVWNVRGNKEPSFMRNVKTNYKRIFFGTINTK